MKGGARKGSAPTYILADGACPGTDGFRPEREYKQQTWAIGERETNILATKIGYKKGGWREGLESTYQLLGAARPSADGFRNENAKIK